MGLTCCFSSQSLWLCPWSFPTLALWVCQCISESDSEFGLSSLFQDLVPVVMPLRWGPGRSPALLGKDPGSESFQPAPLLPCPSYCHERKCKVGALLL